MSSRGGPVSAASGGAASAIIASRRQRGDSNNRNGFGGGNMSQTCRHLPAKRNPRCAERASADSCKRINIAEAK